MVSERLSAISSFGSSSRHGHVSVQVAYVPEGLEAIIFTADGDMRQALNNLQVPMTTCACEPLLQNCPYHTPSLQPAQWS